MRAETAGGDDDADIKYGCNQTVSVAVTPEIRPSYVRQGVDRLDDTGGADAHAAFDPDYNDFIIRSFVLGERKLSHHLIKVGWLCRRLVSETVDNGILRQIQAETPRKAHTSPNARDTDH
jgi:hypothetical protein